MAETELELRSAEEADLPTIVALLVDDPLGARREDASEELASDYRTAFQAIAAADDNQDLLVADIEGYVEEVLQLSFILHLTYKGGWRAQIEGVRVAEEVRSRGVGQALFDEAIARAKRKGCHLVQLTTDRRRLEALKFYLRLGFKATHDGLKLHLSLTSQAP